MTTMTTSVAPSIQPIDVSSRDGLFSALDRITVEGWDGPTADAVLRYAMRAVVIPAVRRIGVAASAAEFSESTGWAAAWETLRSPKLREASSPWGVVKANVRHTVIAERIAETYGTDERSAWQINRIRTRDPRTSRRVRGNWVGVAQPSALARPVSLTALLDVGYEPADSGGVPTEPCPRLEVLIELLTDHGWEKVKARAAVLHVAEHARANRSGPPKAHGWREMVAEVGIPPWQARRVTLLLLGEPGWPGLVERLASGGPAALQGPMIDAAVQATCVHTMYPPARSARSAATTAAPRTALAS